MNVFIIVFIAFILAWLMRLEIKAYNLKAGKHYSLWDGEFQVSYLAGDGSLRFSFGETLFTYKTASEIKKLYPRLEMIDEQTGLEVLK